MAFILYFQSAIICVLKCKICTLEEQSIINLLKANPGITQESIAKEINKSVRTVKSYMLEMKQKGLIERKNGRKAGHWIVK